MSCLQHTDAPVDSSHLWQEPIDGFRQLLFIAVDETRACSSRLFISPNCVSHGVREPPCETAVGSRCRAHVGEPGAVYTQMV